MTEIQQLEKDMIGVIVYTEFADLMAEQILTHGDMEEAKKYAIAYNKARLKFAGVK